MSPKALVTVRFQLNLPIASPHPCFPAGKVAWVMADAIYLMKGQRVASKIVSAPLLYLSVIPTLKIKVGLGFHQAGVFVSIAR